MKNNFSVITEKENQNLKLKLRFSNDIDHLEEYSIVTLCSLAAYFVEKEKVQLSIKGFNTLLFQDQECCHINIENKDIIIIIYLEQLQKYIEKVNAVLISVGCRAFFNIYFNIYQTGGYKDILEYYEDIKIEV